MAVEDMRSALEKEGYQYTFRFDEELGKFIAFYVSPEGYHIAHTPVIEGQWNNGYPVIEKAYAHLLEKRRNAAMESFLRKFVSFNYNYQGTDMQIWQKEAKRLLVEGRE